MADIESKYAVTVTVSIVDTTSGVALPFSDATAVYHDCNRIIMHAIESAVSNALVELGDQGIVMLGGDEAAAVLESAKAAKDKVRGQGQTKQADKFER
jgi:hypothetical protein